MIAFPAMPDTAPDFATTCTEAIFLARTDAMARGEIFTKGAVEKIIREQFALWTDAQEHIPANPTPAPASQRIYEAYPRHVGPKAAIKAISAVLSVVPYEELLGKTHAYAEATKKWSAADRKYIPHPATWFNQGRYADDPKEWARGEEKPTETKTDYRKF